MAWSRAQGKAAGDVVAGGSVASQAATFTSALTNPSLIVASIYYGGTVNTRVTSVTDTAGNTYTRADGASDSGNSQTVEVWYAINASTTASNVVTAHFSPNQSTTAIIIDEFTGGGAGPTLDVHSIASSTGASPGPYTSGPVTPSADGDLIYGTWIQDSTGSSSNAITANGSFAIATSNQSATTGDFATEWFGQWSAASVQASFNWTASGTIGYVVGVIAFKATTGASSTAIAGVLQDPASAPQGVTQPVAGGWT